MLLPVSGLAQEQFHYSRASNCRDIDYGRAMISPGLLHMAIAIFPLIMVMSTPARYLFYTWVC